MTTKRKLRLQEVREWSCPRDMFLDEAETEVFSEAAA